MRQNWRREKNTLLLCTLAISTVVHSTVLLVSSYRQPIVVVQDGDSSPVGIEIQSAPESDLRERSLQTAEKKVFPEQQVDLPEMLTAQHFLEEAVKNETTVTGDEVAGESAPQKTYSPSSGKSHFIAAAKRKIDKRSDKRDNLSKREEHNGEPAAAGLGKQATGTESATADGQVMEMYLKTIRDKIEENKHYPGRARSLRLQGGAMVAFLVLADGQIEGLDIRESSGQGVLDRAALQAVQRAAPFPPHPSIFKQSVLPLEVMLSFRLKK